MQISLSCLSANRLGSSVGESLVGGSPVARGGTLFRKLRRSKVTPLGEMHLHKSCHGLASAPGDSCLVAVWLNLPNQLSGPAGADRLPVQRSFCERLCGVCRRQMLMN
jgi:hypothetical protein